MEKVLHGGCGSISYEKVTPSAMRSVIFPAHVRENNVIPILFPPAGGKTLRGCFPVYLCDCHTHTRISFDSTAALSDMMAAAVQAGVQ